MTYELIICEKPAQAKKIAESLADKKAVKKTIGKVPYYEIVHKGKDIVVGCAVGHLFTLAEKNKKAWSYPIYNFEWKPSYEVSKSAKFSKAYVDALAKLAKGADEFTIATDFDVEGSTIGWNVIKFICNKKDAKRMKFSTLTKDELVDSYEHAMKHLDFPQIESGVTRHSLDWLWGMNLSRALTLSIKNATGMFKILSTGRVQGPTLKVLYEREKEIEAFKPVPYWELELIGGIKEDKEISAWHKEGKFWEKNKAKTVFDKCKGKDGEISDIDINEFKQKPPFPFDLTSLQIEAHSILGISPTVTLQIAQDLYTNGYISYPRTSSQKLPQSLGFKKILEKLKKSFKNECEFLLSKNKLEPNEGKKEDAAHPAIYPTGEIPKKLEGRNFDLYELITRRFFSVFGDDAVRETMTVNIMVNNENFIAKGTRTKVKGWLELYGRFVRLDEDDFPNVKLNEIVKNKEIKMYDKETKALARYNEASIVKEMEKVGIGTKSTRAAIVQNLFDRNYITDKQIKVTGLGMSTVEALEKYCPEILDVELTKIFEEDMEEIQNGKKKGEEIIKDAEKFLDKTLNNFKKHETEIGKSLNKAAIETRDNLAFVGKCPKCNEGDLQIRRGKFGMFIACNRYEQGCETTFNVPKFVLVKGTDKKCDKCNYPMILIIKAKRRPQELCINPECPTKKDEEERIKKLSEGKKCPNCGSNLVVKKGAYGPFLACPGYPKCKYIEKLAKE